MKRAGLILVAVLALIFPACGDDGNGGGPECNNEELETGEQCDGTLLGGETCEGLGYFTGELGCTDQCTYDESNCTNCGNGTKDEGEMCDGQDLDQKNCTDLDYDGGTLKCNPNCTFNGNECYACGNNVIEHDEECDRERFGQVTCKSLGHDGGDLICTNNCTIDDSQCYDCGGVDPCENQLCSGRGSCRVANCIPYCECDSGYTPGVDLTCLEEGTCGDVGEDCTQNEDCCLGACILGYCTGPCEADSNCINNGTDGRDMCCVWGDPTNWCQKTAAAGVSCGDHNGTCGTSCAGALSSACADGHICMGYSEDDPTALCGNQCTADADCDTCGTPGTYECVPTGTGESFCYPMADPCDSTADCTNPELCGLVLNADQTGYDGVCSNYGGADTGSVCDFDPHPWDERCTSGLCLGVPDQVNHCSERCLSDSDCGAGGVCAIITFCLDQDCNDMAGAPVCIWLEGSQDPCATNADCTAEACMPVQMVAGTQTLCLTPLPTDPLCSMCTVDADCGGDSVCIASTANPGEHYCGLPCPVGDECPGGYTCTDVGGAVDNCMPLDDSCMTD